MKIKKEKSILLEDLALILAPDAAQAIVAGCKAWFANNPNAGAHQDEIPVEKGMTAVLDGNGQPYGYEIDLPNGTKAFAELGKNFSIDKNSITDMEGNPINLHDVLGPRANGVWRHLVNSHHDFIAKAANGQLANVTANVSQQATQAATDVAKNIAQRSVNAVVQGAQGTVARAAQAVGGVVSGQDLSTVDLDF